MDTTIQKYSLPLAFGLSVLWLLAAASVPRESVSVVPVREAVIAESTSSAAAPAATVPNAYDEVVDAVLQKSTSTLDVDQFIELLPQLGVAQPLPPVARQPEFLTRRKKTAEQVECQPVDISPVDSQSAPSVSSAESINEKVAEKAEEPTNVVVVQTDKLPISELAKLLADKKKVQIYEINSDAAPARPSEPEPRKSKETSEPRHEKPATSNPFCCPEQYCVPLPTLAPFVGFQPAFTPVVYYQPFVVPVVYYQPLIPVYFVQPIPVPVSSVQPMIVSPPPVWICTTPQPVVEQIIPQQPIVQSTAVATPVVVQIIPSSFGAPTLVFSNGVRMKPTFYVPGQPIRNRVRGVAAP